MRSRRAHHGAALALGVLSAFGMLSCSKRSADAEVRDEIRRREAFARDLLVVDGGPAPALRVTSSSQVHFEEGFTPIQFDPPEDAKSHAFRWMGLRGHVRLQTQGESPMHLRIAGWLNEKVLHQRASVMAYIDGQVVTGPAAVDDKGIFVIDATVAPTFFRGRRWVDLEIVPSSVAFHWLDTPELKVAVIFDFSWHSET